MNLIIRYAAIVMFLLFAVLAAAVAATALPILVIPILTATAVAVVGGLIWRFGR